MDAISRLRLDDLRQMLDDWGEPIVLRRVTQTPSAATGSVVETADDVIVNAVVRDLERKRTGGTTAQHSTHEREFVVSTREIPDGWSWSTGRVVHAGREYSVVGTKTSGDGSVVVVHGQSV